MTERVLNLDKFSFNDVYIKKVFGEVEECDFCNGSGLNHDKEEFVECINCEGKGFKEIEASSL